MITGGDTLVKRSDVERLVWKLVDVIEESVDYFDDRADAEMVDDGYVGNEEMRLLSLCECALSAAKKTGILDNRSPECCPVCQGDCGSANPPVISCPMKKND